MKISQKGAKSDFLGKTAMHSLQAGLLGLPSVVYSGQQARELPVFEDATGKQTPFAVVTFLTLR